VVSFKFFFVYFACKIGDDYNKIVTVKTGNFLLDVSSAMMIILSDF